jgi:hypothetical protein
MESFLYSHPANSLGSREGGNSRKPFKTANHPDFTCPEENAQSHRRCNRGDPDV